MRRLIVASVALGLLLVGCGGNGEDAETAQPPPAGEAAPQEDEGEATAEDVVEAEDQFIRQADRICSRRNEEVQRLSGDREAQFAVVNEGLRELRSLDVPPTLEREFRQYLAAVELQTEADRRGDRAEVRRHQRRKSQIALDLGFAVCGTG